jgi:hypothetical protein
VLGKYCLSNLKDKDKLIAILIAVFAATLAINDLFGNRYYGEEIYFNNEKINRYAWYQAKGIKESLALSQVELLTVLHNCESLADNHEKFQHSLKYWQEEALKYRKEKMEVLFGSKNVGKENWVQDIDGKLGQVEGALELKERVDKLASAGDCFDLSELILQITLVLGAIAVLLRDDKIKCFYLGIIICLGSSGLYFFISGLLKALAIN